WSEFSLPVVHCLEVSLFFFWDSVDSFFFVIGLSILDSLSSLALRAASFTSVLLGCFIGYVVDEVASCLFSRKVKMDFLL
ncbi:hypothetical protein, partial [Haemophilus sp. SZY H56]